MSPGRTSLPDTVPCSHSETAPTAFAGVASAEEHVVAGKELAQAQATAEQVTAGPHILPLVQRLARSLWRWHCVAAQHRREPTSEDTALQPEVSPEEESASVSLRLTSSPGRLSSAGQHKSVRLDLSKLLPGRVEGVPASDGRLLPGLPSSCRDDSAGGRSVLMRRSEAPVMDELISSARPHLAR